MEKESLQSFVESCSLNDLWLLKGLCEQKLVSFNRFTNNFVGERAVDLAIGTYNSIPGLPNLFRTEINTKEVDLYSRDFKGYSVKGLKTSTTTSPFCGYNGTGTEKLFDFVLLVRMNELYQLEEIIEIDWVTFEKYAKYNKRDNNYKLTLTNQLREDSKVVYGAEGNGQKRRSSLQKPLSIN